MNRRGTLGSSTRSMRLSEQCLGRCSVLGGTLDQPENVLVVLPIDADGADQHDILGHVQAVDLNDEQIELGDVACEPFLQSLPRQRHEPARGG
jgi:hypothetical protein